MSLDADNVGVAVSGEVFVGDEDATTPTGFTFDPSANDYDGLGYLTDDGFEITPSMSTSKIVGWQNAAVLRALVTESSIEAKFTCAETKVEVVEAFWATTVNTSTGAYDVDPGQTGGRKKWVFQVIDGDEVSLGTYIGEITDRETITNKSGEVIGYGFTVTFYPSSQFDGSTGRVFDSRLATTS